MVFIGESSNFAALLGSLTMCKVNAGQCVHVRAARTWAFPKQ